MVATSLSNCLNGGCFLERRIDRIYNFIKSIDEQGATTATVASKLTLQRTNVSKDLNQLVREGMVHKTEGRPVHYFVPITLEQPNPQAHVPSYKEEVNPTRETPKKPFQGDIFTQIIGTNGSMRNAVEQAKAAILYPPKGLNCLITGPTGSGKTYFAHAMFQFAQSNQVIDEKQELVVFNCADYANNPELLMSHLFGYTKGSFTGAENDKEGLIQQAHGGMLFLDEIHRLPPEGQEMIFYFMDHGTYSRLGETGKNHHADVRIVGATTEDPHSALLDTFVRRIPINIQLPSFNERPVSEKVDLVRVMVAIEANRIMRRITLTEDVVKALLGSVSYGNIGQLKSNVQLICARGFMNHMQKPEIAITIADITDSVKSGLVKLASNRQLSMELAQHLEPKMVVTPTEVDELVHQDSYELPYNLYDIIGDKAALLKTEGLDQETINQFISTDISIHLKSFYKDHGFSFDTENKLNEFVDPRIIELTNQIAVFVKERLGTWFEQNFIYAMSLHISSFLNKIYLGEERQINDNIRQMVADYPAEFAVAKEIRQQIAEFFQVTIPESEDYYLTVLLVSLQDEEMTGQIGVVVAAHGESTATSMAQVVEKLLNMTDLRSVDMPLEMEPKIAYQKIKEAVTLADKGSGVLLLVDMGSLTSFNDRIQKETGIKVRTLDMVNTPLLIEASRKASVLGTDVVQLYESLKDFQGYGQIHSQPQLPKAQAILAICSSGEGTAQRLKSLIEEALHDQDRRHIEVVPLSIIDMKSKLIKLQEDYHVVAVTGIVDPQIQAPFIPIEKIVNRGASQVLEELFIEGNTDVFQDIELDNESARKVCLNYMEESFTFINPKKLLDPLWEMAEALAKEAKREIDFAFYINLVMHMAGVVERSVLHDPLTATETLATTFKEDDKHDFVLAEIKKIENKLHVKISQEECYYIIQLLNN
jgi:transcriptional regulatory protein LevR/transcriptional regulator with AAA-type ATPase domain